MLSCRTRLSHRGLPAAQVHCKDKLCHNPKIDLILNHSQIHLDVNATGTHVVNIFVDRTDIVMDVGRSLNPAIDIGQIEGAFVQGLGYVTMEEMVHGPDGEILNK